MGNKGIILVGGDDATIEGRARSHGLPLEKVAELSQVELIWDQCLIVEPGTRIPWDLLRAAWHVLDRWDAAVPMWRYGVLAANVGSADDRELAKLVIRDLRVLLHAVELLFVRNGEQGRSLLSTWQAAAVEIEEKRLAFLCALYSVKPRLCVLPRSWLAEVNQWQPPRSNSRRAMATPLVKVEIRPGQYVKVHAGSEKQAAALLAAGSDDMPVVNSSSFKTVNDKSNAGKGRLVRVQVAPNRIVKMYQADAIAQGYLQKKADPAKENKSRPPQENKGAGKPAPTETEPEATVETTEALVATGSGDDLTSITGIGKATERLINAHGIATFEQLRDADLSFLSTQAQQAVEDWKQNG